MSHFYSRHSFVDFSEEPKPVEVQETPETTEHSGFRIQTNVSALRTHRDLTRTTTGYAVAARRVGDDAAGLAIAQRFQREVMGSSSHTPDDAIMSMEPDERIRVFRNLDIHFHWIAEAASSFAADTESSSDSLERFHRDRLAVERMLFENGLNEVFGLEDGQWEQFSINTREGAQALIQWIENARAHITVLIREQLDLISGQYNLFTPVLTQVTEGASATIEAILARMKELATRAAATSTANQQLTLDDEFRALREGIDSASS